MITFLVVFVTLIQINFLVTGYDGLVSPDSVPCLECICKASSACSDIFVCAEKTISKEYWSYAGENIAGGDENRERNADVNYKRCIENRICILNTMYHYTNRVLRYLNMDVNCDGLRGCADIFAAHVFGLNANKPESKFSIGLSKRFDRCEGHGIKSVTNNWFPKNCEDVQN